MDLPTLRGFADELTKIALVSSPEELNLQPGDLLHSRPTEIPDSKRKLFYAVEKRIQRSPFTHSAMYIGDGQIVHAGEKRQGKEMVTGIYREPIEEYAQRYDFKVLRVKADEDVRQRAANYANNQVGKKFNMRGLIGLLHPLKSKAVGKRHKDLKEAYFCSELVANAYSDTNIAKRKKLRHVWPGDFVRSPLTKTVDEYKRKVASAGRLKRIMMPVAHKRLFKPTKFSRSHKPWKLPRTGSQSQR